MSHLYVYVNPIYHLMQQLEDLFVNHYDLFWFIFFHQILPSFQTLILTHKWLPHDKLSDMASPYFEIQIFAMKKDLLKC